MDGAEAGPSLTVRALIHALRNALQPVHYHADLLQDPDIPPDLVGRATEALPQRLAVVDRLLSDAAILARDESFAAEPVSIPSLIQDAVSRWQSLAPIRMSIDGDPGKMIAQVDPLLLDRAVDHLIRNAVEASPKAGIDVFMTWKVTTVEIEISDTGSGLSTDAAAHLFEPFFSTKNEAGRGLGLAVSRRIIAMHGRDLKIENHPEGGVRASFGLPTLIVASPSREDLAG